MIDDHQRFGSCGRLDFPDCDPKAMYTSLQKKLASLPDNTKYVPPPICVYFGVLLQMSSA